MHRLPPNAGQVILFSVAGWAQFVFVHKAGNTRWGRGGNLNLRFATREAMISLASRYIAKFTHIPANVAV